jgi:hypothetical protein
MKDRCKLWTKQFDHLDLEDNLNVSIIYQPLEPLVRERTDELAHEDDSTKALIISNMNTTSTWSRSNTQTLTQGTESDLQALQTIGERFISQQFSNWQPSKFEYLLNIHYLVFLEFKMNDELTDYFFFFFSFEIN